MRSLQSPTEALMAVVVVKESSDRNLATETNFSPALGENCPQLCSPSQILPLLPHLSHPPWSPHSCHVVSLSTHHFIPRHLFSQDVWLVATYSSFRRALCKGISLHTRLSQHPEVTSLKRLSPLQSHSCCIDNLLQQHHELSCSAELRVCSFPASSCLGKVA